MKGILRQLNGDFERDWLSLIEDGYKAGKEKRTENGPERELFEGACAVLISQYQAQPHPIPAGEVNAVQPSLEQDENLKASIKATKS
jgi:hypothetical protein